MTLDWLIVGGGIHGVHLAIQLVREAHIPADRLAIVDGHPRLLARWRACTANTGMTHLRSSLVHHLDPDPWALERFGARNRRLGGFAPPYDRPALTLFDAHCDALIERYGLAGRHRVDRVEALALGEDGVRATLASGEAVSARFGLLALGASERTRWPAWARAAQAAGAPIEHVFDPDVRLDAAQPGRLAVIGGGITAAQLANRFAGERRVHLITRHPLRQHQFDSDPGWVGPRHLEGFARVADPDARRRIITAARHRGSIPPGTRRRLARLCDRGDVALHVAEVSDARPLDGGVRLTVGGRPLDVDRVLLATGFAGGRPGGALVDKLAGGGLPCAACGFPIVDTHLRWHPRLFVSGPLAELEIGPAARNIVGARLAARRIVPWASHHRAA